MNKGRLEKCLSDVFCLFVLPKRCVVAVVAGEGLGMLLATLEPQKKKKMAAAFSLEVKLTEEEVLIWSHDFFL